MALRICSVLEITHSVSRPGGEMGTVIKFPRVRERHETAARAASASAVIIILPVVRIERGTEALSGVKAKAAKSVAKSVAKSPRKRRKRTALAGPPAPARQRG
jgi:hypothetical protein